MRTRLFIPFIAAMVLSYCSYSQDGASIFKKSCAVCHTIGNGKLVGPDLKGSDKKYDFKWLLQFVKSSQTMVLRVKDPKAIQIFKDNNLIVMPDQALSDDEIKTIVAFIGDQSSKLQTIASANGSVVTLGFFQSTFDSISNVSSKTVIYILIAIIAFLTLILFGLGKIIKDISAPSKK